MTGPFIVDAHEDLAYSAISLGRDLLKTAFETRKLEGNSGICGGASTSFPDLIAGNVRIVFGTLWVNPCRSDFDTGPCYTTADEAYIQARAQVEYYRNLATAGVISIITNKSELEKVVDSSESKIGVILLMEGADPIRAPAEAKEWFDLGLRVIGPAWGRTRYCGGTKSPGPLTQDGQRLLEKMEECGFILDCAHFSEESYFEALDLFDGPVIVSHANSRLFCPTDRHLSDEMIEKITSRGGVIGTVLYNAFLDGNWKKGDPKEDVTLAQVIKNIVHVCEVAKSTRHSGIGSDLDGGFGYESIPLELDTASDLFKIGEALKSQAGFSDEDAANVLGGNFLRLLRESLPE